MSEPGNTPNRQQQQEIARQKIAQLGEAFQQQQEQATQKSEAIANAFAENTRRSKAEKHRLNALAERRRNRGINKN